MASWNPGTKRRKPKNKTPNLNSEQPGKLLMFVQLPDIQTQSRLENSVYLMAFMAAC